MCPDNAIAVVENKASIDYNKCTCCGVCDRICKNGALEMKIPQMPSVLDKGVQLGAFKAEMTILKLELKEKEIESELIFKSEPDLIIRCGATRLTDFLIWQSVYSEFYFTDVNWTKFRQIDFFRAVRDFQLRERRFGQ
ncbi:MAG: Tritrans,polycis-undecaprenyl-diphosphate synthase (GGDP specific) [Candidatus Methanophagaceae archaeon]|nr:MAG: Tritrans,polycis-undecaprenyl-diphosphate synthase (GGDP specific) [Methanophagales archaeon]